ncbi:alpha/beta fold hydrolase [Planotetraspora thailandica]|nr:alpha/beta hydrolase [Planotetraspora thailandica]
MTEFFGDLAADSHGTADDRPPLVFLHGLTYDRRQWGRVLHELAVADPGRRAVVFDLPGHGDSPLRDSYRSADVVGVVHEAVTAAGLDRPIIVGHSLGGALATIYAANHPARGVVNVDQPVLVGGFRDVLLRAEPVLRGPEWRQVWNSMLAGMQIELLPADVQELVRTATTPRQDLLLGYWGDLLATPAEELAGLRTRDMGAIRAKGATYHHISGNELAPAYRSWLESVLPEVAVTVLPGSGHFPHLTHPAEVAAILAG